MGGGGDRDAPFRCVVLLARIGRGMRRRRRHRSIVVRLESAGRDLDDGARFHHDLDDARSDRSDDVIDDGARFHHDFADSRLLTANARRQR